MPGQRQVCTFPYNYFIHRTVLFFLTKQCAYMYTPGQKFIDFFNELLHRDNRRNQQSVNSGIETSYLYKFVKYHRCRRNDHGPVPLNHEQRFRFAMSSYTRAAHHCDQRWTCVLMALRDSRSESNLQQFQLRQLSLRLTRFHGIIEFYVFIHCIESTMPDQQHQQFHSTSHHE